MGSSASEEIMVNQWASLLDAEQAAVNAAAITSDFFPFPQSNNTSFPIIQQSHLKPFFSTDPPHYFFQQQQQHHQQQQQQHQQSLLFSLKPSSDLLHFPSSTTATHLLSSLHRSSASNLWDVGEGIMRGRNGGGDGGGGGGGDDEEDCKPRLRVSTTTMKRIKGRKKVREPRFCFKTMSDVDVLDDGYKWRKYGQKVVKNTLHPRSYYRCTQDNCRVKKRVERLAEDPRMVITTYEGRHAHSPSLDNLEETMGQLPSSHLNNFFW